MLDKVLATEVYWVGFLKITFHFYKRTKTKVHLLHAYGVFMSDLVMLGILDTT